MQPIGGYVRKPAPGFLARGLSADADVFELIGAEFGEHSPLARHPVGNP